MNLHRYMLFPIFILSTHWLSVRFYSTYCAPNDIYGYLMSYITVSNPVCSYALKIMDKTGDIYLSLWSIFSIWTLTLFISCYKNITHQETNN